MFHDGHGVSPGRRLRMPASAARINETPSNYVSASWETMSRMVAIPTRRDMSAGRYASGLKFIATPLMQ
jgi:hypothetical protein